MTHAHTGGLSIGRRLTLVPDEYIHMRQQILQLDLEELRDKRGREVQHHRPTPARRGFGHLQRALDPMGEEVPLNVKVLGARQQTCDLGGRKVGRREHLGRAEGGAERAVVRRDDYGAGTCAGGRRLDLVGGEDGLGLVRCLERPHQVVVADGADVGY